MIPVLKVHVPEDAPEALAEVLFSGCVTTGPKTDEFEEKFGILVGNPNVVATNCASSAIALALYLAGVRFKDEVVCHPLTCVAVTESVLQAGASIIWADIDTSTGNISAESIQQRITDRTKAILYSHYLGRLADIDAINAIAAKHNVKTIEDAASALGGEYAGKPIGSHSDYVVFSFQAVKHITTGDGGMLAVKTKAERDRAVLLRHHGNDRFSKRTPLTLGFDVFEPGWKYQMNDIAAALGLCQLKKFAEIKKIYRRNLEIYESRLKNVAGLRLLKEYPQAVSTPLAFTIVVENRTGLVEKLQQQEIGCSVIHMRNDNFTVFSASKSSLSNLDYFYGRVMNIPLGWWVSEAMAHKICDVIISGWGSFAK